MIRAVEESGFFVLRVVTDNHRTNTCMFKEFGGGQLKESIPHPYDPQRKLYFSFDYCHLIKNVRSQFLEREMSDGDGIISSKYIKEIYHLQKNLTVKPVRHLTKKHIEPSSFEKMNVFNAVQIFSPPVTATINFMKSNHGRIRTSLDFSDAGPTINFMECMHKFFTLHDVSDRRQYLRQNNPDNMHFYSPMDERLQWLQEHFSTYIENVQRESKRANLKGLTKETTEALLFTVNSTVQCVTHLLQHGFFYVLTRRFSSDPVEALFSAIRMGGGTNDMTDARTAASAIKRILKSGLIIASKDANIAEENDYHCGEILSFENASGNGHANTDEDIAIVLPDSVLILLEKLRVPDDGVQITLQTASLALISGYLVRVVEERVDCDLCICNITMPNAASSLMELIRYQDRGGLRYPKRSFVTLVKHMQEFVEAALPYCKKSKVLKQ